MVDVSGKSVNRRTAVAQSIVQLTDTIWAQLHEGDIQTKKGPVFQTAILAGIMAAKKTSDLIPLCHPLPLDNCKIDIEPLENQRVKILCSATTDHKTGVEMEALTGASVAALTLYDMLKAVDRGIEIERVRLLEKSGGQSGDYRASSV